jgi:hypothetical protein
MLGVGFIHYDIFTPNIYCILCNGWQHYVPYRWLLIYNKLCDSTLCTCGGVIRSRNSYYSLLGFKTEHEEMVLTTILYFSLAEFKYKLRYFLS